MDVILGAIGCESVLNNIYENVRVLLEEFGSDSNIDIKEKAKAMLKTLS
jgi:hypothetical protein